MNISEIAKRYTRDGFAFPIDVLNPAEAAALRADLEAAEAELADDQECLSLMRAYTDRVLPSFDALVRNETILSVASTVLGPDLLVWSAQMFTKEAHSPKIVSWHQDLTYWGLDDAAETTCWVALSPATRASGCMKFVPGSHTEQVVPHVDTHDDNNMLSRGQEIAVEVNEDDAVAVELEPGQASLHHGHLFHASGPNTTDDRRIGVAIRFISQGNRLNKPLTRLYFLNRGVRAHLFFRRFRMSCTPNDSTAPAFLTHFQAVEDPRQEGEVLYPLEEILLLVLCGVISGADGWTSIALYGQKKLELLRRFLPYENGTPSHDQLGILFSRLDMEVFQSCFISWVASLNETLEGVVAADGKTLRRSFDSSSSQAAIHMVSAWACDQELVLGQRKVDDKSNEITAIPELLELLKIKGAIVAIDAMGCQRKICKNPVIKRRIM